MWSIATVFWPLPVKYPARVLPAFAGNTLALSATGKSRPGSERPPVASRWFAHAAPERPALLRQHPAETPPLFYGEWPGVSGYPAVAVLWLTRTPGGKQGDAPGCQSDWPDNHWKGQSAYCHQVAC